MLTLVTRCLTRSRVLYDVDSVNFAFALRHYDPAVHQPHPPGYFLYVLVGRVANSILPDPNDALVGISILSSCVAVWLVYRLAGEWFGRGAALAAGVLFVASPLVWFHGTVALTYIVEMAFSAAAGLLCWRASNGSRGHALGAAAVIAVSAGFRQSSALFLLPLLLFALWRGSVRLRVGTAVVFLLGVMAWAAPMLYVAGGLGRYLEALWVMWSIVPGKVSTETSGAAMILARGMMVAIVLGALFGPAWLFPWQRRPQVSPEIAKFTAVWITPALLFFVLVFFKLVNAGYLLVVAPPLFALTGAAAASWIRETARPSLRVMLPGAIIACNLGIYLFAPGYFSLRAVRAVERGLANAVQSVRACCPAAGSVVVGFDSHFLGYRHAAYYLPEFRVVQYPEVLYASGAKVFAVRDGRTEVTATVATAGVSRAVLFPLPEGSQYEVFVRPILKALDHMPHSGKTCVGADVCIAQPELLTSLFPRTVSPRPVYTTVDTATASDNCELQSPR